MLNLLTIYAGLFAWSFLAATLLPLGSEAALIAIVRTEEQVFVPVVVATAGNYLGACTTYWLGRRTAQALGKDQREGERSDTRAARLLRRYGQPALLLSWVPLIGDALVALAGGMKLPFLQFSFWTVLGKAARYLVVAWAASVL
ncbi:MAG: DedA family protein [Acidobacteriota bacterium]|nr:DedA family protein [Acidobacteriota bacterium]